jgi:hypothetical protein
MRRQSCFGSWPFAKERACFSRNGTPEAFLYAFGEKKAL